MGANQLGKPDVPSPQNEYYQNYCNPGQTNMSFGETEFATSVQESSSTAIEETSSHHMEGGTSLGGGFSIGTSMCVGFLTMVCTETNTFSFMVSVGYTGEREQEDGKTETNSTATKEV